MEKLSVTVNIPALSGIYDFIVPSNMSVRDIIYLMLRILGSEYGVSENISDVSLFDAIDGSMLRLECSFSQLNISDGSRLVLM